MLEQITPNKKSNASNAYSDYDETIWTIDGTVSQTKIWQQDTLKLLKTKLMLLLNIHSKA